MSKLSASDLKDTPSIYESSRDLWNVLVGVDAARPLIEASSSGDNTTLENLLTQTQWIAVMLQSPHCIYSIYEAKKEPEGVGQVMAMPVPNVQRAMILAADNGHAAVMSTLLSFAKQHNVKYGGNMRVKIIMSALFGGHASVIEELVLADPNIIDLPLLHDTRMLYEAVRLGKVQITVILLRHGADPRHPVGKYKKIGGFGSSLLSHAAKSPGPRLIEMLLAYDLPVTGSGALQKAAALNRLDNMRFLIERGADVDEVTTGSTAWTAMHWAAWGGNIEAMELLESSGARSDVTDKDGNTPAQILEETKAREQGR